MSLTLLDGKTLAHKIRMGLKEKVAVTVDKSKEKPPVLATILVGQDPASVTYVRMKLKACAEIGMGFLRIDLAENTATEELLKKIDELNKNPNVTGILLQHPVPPHIDERAAFDRIARSKDVDGVGSANFGRMALGLESFPSCTPAGILRLIDAYGIPIQGQNAVVVGRSPILGRPMAMLLLERDASVTICHSKTKDLARHLAHADIVIAACGQPKLIRGEWLKEGVCVIDAGYNAGNVGDADFESCKKKASFITPVPGGVGPMTIAILLEHSLKAL